jgi:hypothetical protein
MEQAAARSKTLSPLALREPLAGLDLLAQPRVDAPTRHHTLGAAIGWSYDLLTPREQRLLRLLGVFVGGCGLDTIEALAEAPDALDLLSSLVDKPLLRSAPHDDAHPHFRLFESIRAFALSRLQAAGELQPAREAHAALFEQLTHAAETLLTGPDQVIWHRRLAADLDNLWAAIDWLFEHGQHDRGIAVLWSMRFLLAAGPSGGAAPLLRFDRCSERPGPLAHARLVHAEAFLAMHSGRFAEAVPLFEQCASEATSIEDWSLLGSSLMNQAFCLPAVGHIQRARALMTEAAAAWVPRRRVERRHDPFRLGRIHAARRQFRSGR